MYKCSIGSHQVKRGIPRTLIVTKSRSKEYWVEKRNEEGHKTVRVVHGWEIVEEVPVCPEHLIVAGAKALVESVGA